MSILNHLLIPLQSHAAESDDSGEGSAETRHPEEGGEWGDMLAEHAAAVAHVEHRTEEWGQMLADHAAAQPKNPEAEDEEE